MTLACAEGCNHCCRTFLIVPAADVLMAYAKVESLDRSQLRTRLRFVEKARKAGQPPLMCPLNENGRCAIYPGRPTVCAQRASDDVEKCKRLEDAVLRADKTPIEMEMPSLEAPVRQMPFPGVFHFAGALEALVRRPESAAHWCSRLPELYALLQPHEAKS